MQNAGANCSTTGLCCVTITWQQIFEDALQVTVVGVLLHAAIERRLLGRQCCETATGDSGYRLFHLSKFLHKFVKLVTSKESARFDNKDSETKSQIRLLKFPEEN